VKNRLLVGALRRDDLAGLGVELGVERRIVRGQIGPLPYQRVMLDRRLFEVGDGGESGDGIVLRARGVGRD
jgi:hypothetical protein